MKILFMLFVLISMLAPISANATAIPGQVFTFEGQLLDASNVPLASPANITLQIWDPAASCLLFEEQHSVTLTSEGFFSVRVGGGTRASSGTDDGLQQKNIFQNITSMVGGGSCNYTPTSIDSRLLRVIVDSTPLSPDFEISAVPMAIAAHTIGGKTAADFLTVNSGVSQSAFTINNGNELRLRDSSNTNHVGLKAPFSMGTPYVLTFPNSAGSSGDVLTTDGTGTLSWTAPAVGGGGTLNSINGQSGSSQSLAFSYGGLNPNFSSSANTHTLNIPMASTTSVVGGLISNADYVTFSGKQSALGFAPLNQAGGVMTGNLTMSGGYIDLGTSRIQNVGNPISAQDSATKNYVDTQDANLLKKDGSVALTADWNVGSHKLTNVTDPTGAQDAATKNYVLSVTGSNLPLTGGTLTGTMVGRASTTSANTAPIKLPSGVLMTTPEAGSIEYDGTNLYYTNSSNARQTIATGAGADNLGNHIATQALNLSGYALNGNSGASANFSIHSTSHATKGDIYLNPAGGNVAVGFSSPTARLHLPASTTAAGSAPLKFQTGVLMSSPEAGAIEYDGTNLWYTDSSNVRHQLGVSGGNVTSFNGRQGAVVPVANDYTWAQINRSTSSLADLTTRDAADLTGTLADARLSASVPLKNSSNFFPVGNQHIQSTGGAQPALIVQSGSSQSGSLFLAKDNGGTTLYALDPSGIPSSDTDLTDKGYVDAQVSTVGSTKLSLSGGTMSGALTLPSNGLVLGGTQLVANGGNIGIGTASPASKLDVNGTIRATDICDEAGNNCKDISTGWASGPAGANGQIQFNNGAMFSGTSSLHWDNTNFRLGVGTSTPSDSVHVNSGSNPVGIRVESTGSSSMLMLTRAGVNNTLSAGLNGSPNMQMNVGSDGYNELTVQQSAGSYSGRVGINNDTPQAHLHVVGTSSTPTHINEVVNNTYYPSMKLRRARSTPGSETAVQLGDFLGMMSFTGYDGSGYTNTGARIFAMAAENHSGGAVGTDLSFDTTANGTTTSTTKMTISNAGNVGIGTTTPSAKMDIRGTSGSPLLKIENTTSTNKAEAQFVNNSGNALRVGMAGSSAGGLANSGYVGTVSSENLVLQTAGIDRVVIDGSSGNVGIGLTGTAAAKVQVKSSVNTESALLLESHASQIAPVIQVLNTSSVQSFSVGKDGDVKIGTGGTSIQEVKHFANQTCSGISSVASGTDGNCQTSASYSYVPSDHVQVNCQPANNPGSIILHSCYITGSGYVRIVVRNTSGSPYTETNWNITFTKFP